MQILDMASAFLIAFGAAGDAAAPAARRRQLARAGVARPTALWLRALGRVENGFAAPQPDFAALHRDFRLGLRPARGDPSAAGFSPTPAGDARPSVRPGSDAWLGLNARSLVPESRPPSPPLAQRRPPVNLVFPHTFVPWFRSVAPYIHMHRGKTFVVGIAGEAIAAGKLHHIAQDLAIIQSMGVKIVLVHGFRPQVNEQLRAKGHESRYHHGMRITDEVALDCAQEAAGQLRYEIEAAFSQGLPNTPMAGATVRVISGNFITARPVGIVDGVDFQHSRPGAQGRRGGIRRALDIGAMVLLSPFGFSPTGEAFNLTMEEVATSVAIALQADKLIFLTEMPGIRAGPRGTRVETTRSTPSCRWPPPNSCWPPARRRSSRPTPPSTCSTASRPAEAASSAATSCRSRSTARCCWRSTCTTASAPWWSTRSSRACAKRRPTTSAASCS